MIREPAVAGQFYPADRASLRKEIDFYIKAADPPIEAKAIIAPHAGYIFSGSVAGLIYGAVRVPERVILLGPNHTGRGAPLSLYPAGEWRTPLGMAPIDAQLNDSLKAECSALVTDTAAHGREHSLEVQIPFLQSRVSGFRFAAICVGTADYSLLEALGRAMARVVQSSKDPILMVCSSDMNHFESAEITEAKDRLAIGKIEALDPQGLYRVVREKHISMCGFAPAVSVLTACIQLGATGARLVRYANSGDISGDYGSVVGYAGIAID
jgi:AmmeMemoRadiSam system protein B